MQSLRLHVAGNIKRFGQKIRVPRGGLFHFTPLHLSVRSWNFFHRFEFVLIRNSKHRPDYILFPAPRRGDIGHGFIASAQSLAQNVGNHRQRNQQHQHERADSEQLDDGAMAPPKRRLRFRQRRWCLHLRHAAMLNQANPIRQLQSRYVERLFSAATEGRAVVCAVLSAFRFQQVQTLKYSPLRTADATATSFGKISGFQVLAVAIAGELARPRA